LNDDEIVSMVRWGLEKPIQLRFIELMPFSGNSYSKKLFLGKNDIISLLQDTFGEDLRLVKIDGPVGSIGDSIYKVRDFPLEIGIISSMTDAFCNSCDRLRLTADGNMRNCLFARSETSLRDAIRSGDSDAVEMKIRQSVEAKFFAHGGVSDILGTKPTGRPMVSIGG
jgi:cyclic pyranopterin phosphate synthase